MTATSAYSGQLWRMVIASLLLVLGTIAVRGERIDDRPNILLIFADDLGWPDVGYQGAGFIETPNIDRLARQGMIFSSAYAAAGNCMPSRACLLSGQYTPRHGAYAVRATDRGPRELMRLVPIPNRDGLAESNLTLAEVLQSAGYATGIFGKWHLDGPGGASQAEQGFDVVHVSQHKWKGAAGVSDDPKGIDTLACGVEAFMETNRDRPFFAYLSHYAIHTKHQARAGTLEYFSEKPPVGPARDPLYAACTFDLDASVGRVLAKLDELGLADNTLVVFTSDNGGIPGVPQDPLRGNKGSYYEGGIRVPFIVRWSGQVEAGSRCDLPVINQDLYPTFLAAAGIDVPAGKVLDGENLLPCLRTEGDLLREAIFWHFPGYLGEPVVRGRDPVFRTRPVSVIRQGNWKLLLYHEEWVLDGGRAALPESRAVELYDLRSDLGEHRNLAASQPDQRDKLLDELLTWMARIEAPLPYQPNPDYRPGSLEVSSTPKLSASPAVAAP